MVPETTKKKEACVSIKSLAAAAALSGVAAFASTPVSAGQTFDAVKAKGFVQCAVNTGLAGFSFADSQGKWTGLDVDLCRAIAAAMFGDAEKAKYTPTTAQQRFVALQSGEVDVITRNATQTLMRDTSLGFNIAGVNFYDGQGFMVPAKSGIKSAKELNGATICVQPGTTTELNLADYFRKNKMNFKPVLIEKLDELLQAYAAGRCDSYTTDASGLAAVRAGQLAGKGEHTILPERISKEPLGPIVRHGDDQWFDVVKWTLMGMIEAEELGITSKNVDEMLKSDDPVIKRFLGVTPGYGKAVGVDEKWMYNIIKQVGNYGESYDRHVGPNTPLKLERGQNALWTNGGLMYAIPFR
jgi:general L-amino acid transport system substrate-binding protein